MDMMIREVRSITDGPLKIIRFGSCGTLDAALNVGSIIVADSCCMVSRNPDYFHSNPGECDPYFISSPVKSSKVLTETLYSQLESIPGVTVVKGMNATADSFYSSQGRIDPNFRDDNSGLINSLMSRYPHLRSFEMETFQLLSLAAVCEKDSIEASACAMVFASRVSNEFISSEKIEKLVLY